jgi:hypothetical protein
MSSAEFIGDLVPAQDFRVVRGLVDRHGVLPLLCVVRQLVLEQAEAAGAIAASNSESLRDRQAAAVTRVRLGRLASSLGEGLQIFGVEV